MRTETVAAINNLFNDTNKQFEEIVNFYKKNEITVDDILNQDAVGLKISPHNVNRFAVQLCDGKDGLSQNEKLAFKLFECAAQKGSGWAKYNAGTAYLLGKYDIKKDIDKAIPLYKEALEKKDELDYQRLEASCQLSLGNAYTEKKLLREALWCFRQVKSEDKDNYKNAQAFIKEILELQLKNIYESIIEMPHFTNLNQFCCDINAIYKVVFEKFQSDLKLKKPEDVFLDETDFTPTGIGNRLPIIEVSYKEFMNIFTHLTRKFPEKEAYYNKYIRLLTYEFSKANPNIKLESLPQVERLSINEKQINVKPGWFLVSPILEGYELPMISEINFKMDIELAEIELKKAQEKSTLADSYLEKARNNKMPNGFIEELRQKAVEFEKQKSAPEKLFNEAKQKYDSLINEAENKEFQRQIQTEKHFFSPHRTNNPFTRDKALLIQKNRIVEGQEEVQALKLTDVPSRRMITAEISTIEASLRLYGRGNSDYDAEYGWHTASRELVGYYNDHEIKHGNTEEIQLGATEISYYQKVNPHCNHTGDYFMFVLGNYNNIISIINSITGTQMESIQTEKEKKLAEYMLRFSKHGIPVSLGELKELNPKAIDESVNEINRIFYHCFVKEPARWMLPRATENELPFAIAQIRAVKLIIHGYLSMSDVFAQYAPYGVFTDKEVGKNIAKVREKIRNINRMYTQLVLMPQQEHAGKHVSFFKSHKSGQFVTTRKELHHELKDAYGGDSDTDDEGYDSDTADKLYSGAFKF